MRLSLALLVLTPSILGAQGALTRQVHGDTLISGADPATRFVFAQPFQYAGGQAIDVVQVAGAEQFFFIDAAEDKSIRRFYWVQFEQYYPTNTHTYDFSGIRQTSVPIGRLIFQGDVRVRANYFTMDKRPNSDSRAAQEFLRAKGFNIEGTFATLRLFYLPDSTRRRELMIIYGERVPEGTTEAAVAEGITARAQAGVSQP
jgi:hypothetical protein